MTDTTTTEAVAFDPNEKGLVRSLRHQVRNLLSEHYEVAETVGNFLAGRAGLSFAEQRSNVLLAKGYLVEDVPDLPEVSEAITVLDKIVAVIDAREAEYNKQFTPQFRLEQVQAEIESLKAQVSVLNDALTEAYQRASAIEAEALEDEAKTESDNEAVTHVTYLHKGDEA